MYVDVDVLYALIKIGDRNREFAQKIAESNEPKYTSTMALIELELVVKRELGDSLSLHTSDLVKKIMPELVVKSFSKKEFDESLELREKHGLGIFDAAHAASCLENDCIIASTDSIYDRILRLKRIKS